MSEGPINPDPEQQRADNLASRRQSQVGPLPGELERQLEKRKAELREEQAGEEQAGEDPAGEGRAGEDPGAGDDASEATEPSEEK